jgi:TorA maturation chaperone TorD
LQAVENTSNSEIVGPAATLTISPEDHLRAQVYQLLARLLSQPPDKSSLQTYASLKGDAGEFGDAINNFATIAGRISQEAADTEFHDLFVGLTRGELLPFGSYYLTGFLNEKPLAKLRSDMARLGVGRIDGLKDPEDHIASVLEIMAGLIDGSYGEPLSMDEQKSFFNTHINSWAGQFFSDLAGANNSVLYAPLGTVGALFMKIEQSAFEMS